MVLFNNIYCQTCARFITKKQWNNHLSSNRHLHTEMNGYWPAYFPQRKLTRDEGIMLEKAFWEMIFGNEDVLPVYGFLKTYNTMVTNMKDYVTLDPDDVDADFRYSYRDTMIAQFSKIYITKISVFKIKVKVIKSKLSRTKLYLGIIILIWGVQYLINFMIVILTTMD